MIVKPGRRVVYTGCNWSRIDEGGSVGELVAEKVTIIATRRVETAL